MEKTATGILSNEDIQAKFAEGSMTLDQAKYEGLRGKIANESPYDFTAEQTIDAHKFGLITTEQVEDITENAESPVWHTTKENLKGVAYAAHDLVGSVADVSLMVQHGVATLLSDDDEKVSQHYEAQHGEVKDNRIGDSMATSANMTRGVAEFSMAFFPLFRAAKALKGAGSAGAASEFMNATVAGAITDFTISQQGEERLSNLVQEYPELQNPVTEFLQSDEDESMLEAKFKGALEGTMIGASVDSLFMAIKGLKYLHGSKAEVHRDPQEMIDGYATRKTDKAAAKEADEAAKEVTEPTTPPIKDEAVEVPKKAADDVAETTTKEVDEVVPEAVKSPEFDPEKIAQVARNILDPESTAVLPEEVGFRMSSLQDADEAWDIIGEIEAGLKTEMNDFRGGEAKSFEITQQDADKYGADYDKIKDLWGATKDLEAKFLASKSFLDIMGEQLATSAKALQKNADGKNLGDADLYEFYDQVKFFGELQGMVRGVQTNAARTVSAGRIKVGKESYRLADDSLSQLEEAINQAGGRSGLEDFLGNFVKHGNSPEARNLYARNSGKAGILDMTQFYWLNSLLSGVGTQAVNVVGGGLSLATNIVEHHVAVTGKATLGTMFGSGQGLKEFTEISAMWRGMGQGLKEGIHQGWVAFKENSPQLDALTKFEHQDKQFPSLFDETGLKQNVKDIVDSSKGEAKPIHYSKVISKILYNASGDVFSIPMRFLMASDEAFKNISYRGEIHRMAAEGANKIDDAVKREKYLKKALQEPSQKAHSHAIAKARELTFTEEFRPVNPRDKQDVSMKNPTAALNYGTAAVGTGADKMFELMQKMKTYGGGANPIAYVIPFLRTPMNIVKFTARRTPVLNVFSKRFHEDLMAGGTRAYQAYSRVAAGTGLYALGHSLWEDEVIVGKHPKHLAEAYKNAGIPEDSIKIGEKYVQFNRLDPIGMFIGLSADVSQAFADSDLEGEDGEHLMADLLLALGENVTNKTYMKGVSDLIKIQTDPERYSAETYGANLASTFIPYSSFRRQLSSANDPYLRERDEINDYFLNVTDPEKLAPKIDILGNKVKRPKKTIYAITTGELSDNYIYQQMFFYGANVAEVGKNVQYKGESLELTKRERNELKGLVKEAKLEQRLTALFKNIEGKVESKAYVQQLVKKEFESARQTAQQLYLQKHPEKMDELIAKVKRTAQAIKRRDEGLNQRYENIPMHKSINREIQQKQTIEEALSQ